MPSLTIACRAGIRRRFHAFSIPKHHPPPTFEQFPSKSKDVNSMAMELHTDCDRPCTASFKGNPENNLCRPSIANGASRSKLAAGSEPALIARVIAGEVDAFHDLVRP